MNFGKSEPGCLLVILGAIVLAVEEMSLDDIVGCDGGVGRVQRVKW